MATASSRGTRDLFLIAPQYCGVDKQVKSRSLLRRDDGTPFVGMTARPSSDCGLLSVTRIIRARYGPDERVYMEEYASIAEAIAREKQLKRWSRVKEVALIGRPNPNWQELTP